MTNITTVHAENVIGLQKEIEKALSVMLFTVVQIPANHLFLGGDSTEFVLRSGSATVHRPPEAGGGLLNVTAGVDLAHGIAVPMHNLLIFPVGDGRAIRAVSGIWAMVKGNYEIVPV